MTIELTPENQLMIERAIHSGVPATILTNSLDDRNSTDSNGDSRDLCRIEYLYFRKPSEIAIIECKNVSHRIHLHDRY